VSKIYRLDLGRDKIGLESIFWGVKKGRYFRKGAVLCRIGRWWTGEKKQLMYQNATAKLY
jgi:hypothetical protein